MTSIKKAAYSNAQWLLDWIGLDVSFARPVRNPVRLLSTKATELGARTVLDVGANVGQFGHKLRKSGYTGTIVSFEPLSDAYRILTKAAANDPSWYVAPRMALGEAKASTTINVSHNLASSSLLKVQQSSIRAAPQSDYRGTEQIEMNRLDDVMESTWHSPYAIKLDTQGYELHVLRGAPRTLDQSVVVMAEMSLTPLYEGGPSFNDVFEFFERSGFRCITITHGFADNERNELLQVDGVFVR